MGYNTASKTAAEEADVDAAPSAGAAEEHPRLADVDLEGGRQGSVGGLDDELLAVGDVGRRLEADRERELLPIGEGRGQPRRRVE